MFNSTAKIHLPWCLPVHLLRRGVCARSSVSIQCLAPIICGDLSFNFKYHCAVAVSPPVKHLAYKCTNLQEHSHPESWSQGGRRRRVGVRGTPSHTRSKGGWASEARSAVAGASASRWGERGASSHHRIRVETSSDLERGGSRRIRVGLKPLRLEGGLSPRPGGEKPSPTRVWSEGGVACLRETRSRPKEQKKMSEQASKVSKHEDASEGVCQGLRWWLDTHSGGAARR